MKLCDSLLATTILAVSVDKYEPTWQNDEAVQKTNEVWSASDQLRVAMATALQLASLVCELPRALVA